MMSLTHASNRLQVSRALRIRYAMAKLILAKFQNAFPEISYDFDWLSDSANGMAWMEVSQRCVRVYGGLLRHKLLTKEALILVLAHETGHHYGGAPYDEHYKWMSTESQADYWAARIGVRLVVAENRNVISVVGQAARVLSGINAGEEGPIGNRDARCTCIPGPDLRCCNRVYIAGAFSKEKPPCIHY
jgi:hypothetical protein